MKVMRGAWEIGGTGKTRETGVTGKRGETGETGKTRKIRGLWPRKVGKVAETKGSGSAHPSRPLGDPPGSNGCQHPYSAPSHPSR